MPIIMFIPRRIEEVLIELDYDPYWENVVLLMHMDGTDNGTTFIDETGKTVTRVGDTKTVVAEKKFGTASAHFDGNGDYLSVALGTLSSDFTIELFVLLTGFSSYQGFLSSRAIGSGTGISITKAVNSIEFFIDGQTITTPAIFNEWVHLALVRQGSLVKAYVNGTSIGSFTYSGIASLENTVIGRYYHNANDYYLTGYIDEVRITKSVARYTENFDVPTKAFSQNLELDFDWYWNDVALLVRGSQNDKLDKTFIDSSVNAFTLTKYGNVRRGNRGPLPNTGSIYFDGNGDYLTFPNSSNFAIGTSDFTIEFWVKGPPGQDCIIFGTRNAGSTTFHLTSGGYNGLTVQDSLRYAGTEKGTTTKVFDNTWHHCAVSRQGTTVRLFVDGVKENEFFDNTLVTGSAGTLIIGAHDHSSIFGGGAYMKGYISNFRITRQALYTTDFVVPTQQLTAVQDTVLLITAEDTGVFNSNNVFLDSSDNDLTINAFGNVSQGKSDNIPGAYSAYFDGSGDYLHISNSNTLAFGTGDFTVEFWVKPEAFYNYITIVSTRTGVNTSSWSIGTQGAANMLFYAGSELVRDGFAMQANTWYHFAFVRSAGVLKGYRNGVQFGSVANTYNFTSNSMNVGTDLTFGESFKGFISNLRVAKEALYTSNFTVPQSPLQKTALTSLLLGGANAGIVDDSGKHVFESQTGLISTTRKSGETGLAFSGSNRLRSNSSGFILGTSDFTLEMYVYPTSLSGTQGLISTGNGAQANPYLYLADAIPTLFFNNVVIATGPALTLNKWNHIACVKESGEYRIFTNGVSGNAASNATALLTAGPITIGASSVDSQFFQGYIDELRLTKGVARYSSKYIPKSRAALAISGPTNFDPLTYDQTYGDLAYDPIRQRVVSHLPLTSLLDTKGSTAALIGNPTFSTYVKKFSGSVQTSNGNLLRANLVTPIRSSDFTFDFWIYPTSFANTAYGHTLFDFRPDGQQLVDATRAWVSSLGSISVGKGVSDSVCASTNGIIQLDTWHHIAIVRRSGTITIYVDGQSVASGTYTDVETRTEYKLGGNAFYQTAADTAFIGNIEDFRVTRAARYVRSFTPPNKLSAINGASF